VQAAFFVAESVPSGGASGLSSHQPGALKKAPGAKEMADIVGVLEHSAHI
jgi:hypothetical protein